MISLGRVAIAELVPGLEPQPTPLANWSPRRFLSEDRSQAGWTHQPPKPPGHPMAPALPPQMVGRHCSGSITTATPRPNPWPAANSGKPVTSAVARCRSVRQLPVIRSIVSGRSSPMAPSTGLVRRSRGTDDPNHGRRPEGQDKLSARIWRPATSTPRSKRVAYRSSKRWTRCTQSAWASAAPRDGVTPVHLHRAPSRASSGGRIGHGRAGGGDPPVVAQLSGKRSLCASHQQDSRHGEDMAGPR